MKNGIYIYGMIKTATPQEFGKIGIGDSEVQTLSFKGVAAVISASPFMIYDSLAKEKTVKDLVTHQFVLEKVMEHFSIVPMKFGTMVESTDDVAKFLEKGYGLLSEELGKIEGTIELDLVVSWELPKVLAALYHGNREIQQQQRDIALKGAKASVEDKITLGKCIEQALQAQKASYQQLIVDMLSKETLTICSHDLANDEMIFNAAFLVEKKHEESFSELVTLLDQKLENALRFRVVGPLPPYSFATILLERIDPRKLEEAKNTFGLQGELTDKTVRDAYRQLVQKAHPDKNRGEAPIDFHRLTSAYKTLTHFIENGLMQIEVYHWEKHFQ